MTPMTWWLWHWPLGFRQLRCLCPRARPATNRCQLPARIAESTRVDCGGWFGADAPLFEYGRKSLFEFLSAALPAWALEDISVIEPGLEPHVRTIVRKRGSDQIFPGSVVDGDD